MKWRKSLGLLLLAVVMLFGFGAAAKAEEYVNNTPYWQSTWKTYFVKGGSYYLWLDGVASKEDVTDLKVSNKKIATAKLTEFSEGDYIVEVSPKKAGTVTVSAKAKANGKTYDLKTKFKFYKYTNPFKSFKIGKKSIAKKFASRDYYTKMGLFNGTKTLSKQKISIKVKSGWKIRRIELQHFTPVTDEDGEHLMYDEKGSRTIKNNTKVDILPHSSLFIEVYNKKTKTSIYALVE